MEKLTKQAVVRSLAGKAPAESEQVESLQDSLTGHVADFFVFLGILVLSAVAILAVAIATPLVLAISAVAGLRSQKNGTGNWRPAGA